MSIILKFSSSEADLLFERLNAADPVEVISELAFIKKLWREGNNEIIFEYDTDHNHAWYLLGLAYEKLGESKEAALCFKIATSICSNDADAYVAYSNTEDDLDAQITHLEVGLRQFEDSRVRFNLANALLDLGRPQKALYHLEKITPDFSKYPKVVEAKDFALSILEKNEEK